ncbi:MAG: hypothetical protein OXJ55_13590 [Caldilineaceae bacterium]|nr:hypothetical protein [Caldilineaceae bacterium]MDE0461674.1 hypothetical protein [Caldilineaceae bacterium]
MAICVQRIHGNKVIHSTPEADAARLNEECGLDAKYSTSGFDVQGG